MYRLKFQAVTVLKRETTCRIVNKLKQTGSSREREIKNHLDWSWREIGWNEYHAWTFSSKILQKAWTGNLNLKFALLSEWTSKSGNTNILQRCKECLHKNREDFCSDLGKLPCRKKNFYFIIIHCCTCYYHCL